MIIDTIVKPYVKGLHLGTYTYLFSHILDHTIAKDDLLSMVKHKPTLFNQCATTNFINLIGLTPIYYIFVDNFLINHILPTHIQPIKIFSILFIHNLLFYITHLSFHSFKSLYFIHRFHHKFNKPIPSSGNAVSILEYNFAYVMPFLIAAFFIKPNDLSFRISVSIISFLNAIIHTIPFYNFSINPFLIKPGDHIEHHEKLTVKFAAPLLNIDYIISLFKDYNQKIREFKYNGSYI